MCGIFIEICKSESQIIHDKEILHRIKNRGPDYAQTSVLKLNERKITFFASVLWMQGLQPTLQPIDDETSTLLYNGDIFDKTWNFQKSDTEQIMEKFLQSAKVSLEDVITQIRSFKGPFSIIYYNKLSSDLLFTRDRIGRNSLLLYKDNDNIVISSVLGKLYECIEVPATHIYILNLVTNKVKCYPWDSNQYYEFGIDYWIQSIKTIQSLPDEKFSVEHQPTDLNMQDGVVQFIQEASEGTKDRIEIFKKLLSKAAIRNEVLEIIRRLDLSVSIRLKKQPQKCKSCLRTLELCTHSAVGILFSGGLDCTLIALLADKYIPKEQSIDLLNVAFKKCDNTSYNVPDRLTGRQSLEELKKICPDRRWIFEEINIHKEQLAKYQETVIGDLVYPRQTILDESLGTALWFAARGNNKNSDKTSRLLLLGSGADELFGGYTRHRNAFKRYGWSGLTKELMLDWKRISFRNLARDNRVICDHGRQPRMPYLDDEFAEYILNLKPWFKCFPSEELGPGIGDKLFLRLSAFYLGLETTAVLPKRALQFGSRIANKKQRGSDISTTFLK